MLLTTKSYQNNLPIANIISCELIIFAIGRWRKVIISSIYQRLTSRNEYIFFIFQDINALNEHPICFLL